MRKMYLRKQGKSEVSQAKREIQSLVREIVILRDGGCILKKIRYCTDPVLQADHLITRGNSATFADTRLIVCLCRSCHGGFKKWHKEQYDALLRSILPKDRVELWERCLRESWKPVKMNWRNEIIALTQEYARNKI